MKYWVINHSWESFRRTKEYCGFDNLPDQERINIDDKIIYYGQGLVFGIFEATEHCYNEFRKWERNYPHQVKLKPIVIAKGGLMAKPLQDKIQAQKAQGGSSNLVELSENEFNQIKEAIETGKKELQFT